MEENQTQFSNAEVYEPDFADNSQSSAVEKVDSTNYQTGDEGESDSNTSDPSQNLILGKFKSVEDLSKAYEELQRHQGLCSEELGELRKNSLAFKQAKDNLELLQKYQRGFEKRIRQDQEKYSAPEYFQDPSFREMYSEVFKVFGEDLDTDRFVNLLEGYVASRIMANEKKRAAKNETEQVLNSMSYSKNSKTSFTPPQKRFDEMTPQEIDDLLEKLI
ncbi:MAG: hypothetical protein NC408_07875 [Candidatus Gastranaerophilales bacterium]|nr:hypothetical protein [Candidatus Gastranaerophilales bacterium]MCM1072587.1 hypothetical protein [Bacteroides sp.]